MSVGPGAGTYTFPCDCCGCSCASYPTLTVTLDGTSLVGACTTCPTFGGDDSMSGPGGDFDGVYTLTRVGETCCWHGTITTEIHVWQGTADCTPGTEFVVEEFDIELCLVHDGEDVYWTFRIEGSNGVTVQLFGADNVATTEAWCGDLPDFTNLQTVMCGFATYWAGGDGTATITP